MCAFGDSESKDLTDSARNRGHGTYVESEDVIASVAGIIERVNKLVTVRAIRSRFVFLRGGS